MSRSRGTRSATRLKLERHHLAAELPLTPLGSGNLEAFIAATLGTSGAFEKVGDPFAAAAVRSNAGVAAPAAAILVAAAAVM
jgi:hypothetical protein